MDDEVQAAALAAADDAGGVDPELLGDYLDELANASATGSRLDADALASCQVLGGKAADAGVPLRALVDLYLSATWRAWRLLPAVREASDLPSMHTIGEAVLRAADDAVAAAAEGYQSARRWLIRREEAARREFVDDLLSGAAEPSRLLTSAEQYGVDVVGRHLVAVCTGQPPFRDATPTVARVEDSVAAAAGDGSLVATKEGQLVCVIPAPARGGAGGKAERALHELEQILGRTFSPDNWRCGVGRPHVGPAGLVRSYDEAKDALHIAELLRLPRPMAKLDDLLVYRVLLRDREALVDLIDAVLSPLRLARGGAAPLLDTIAAYAAAGANAAATARRLHLSVRAVTYRLSRVRELTGYNPAKPADLYVLHTAALGARMIGWAH